jgi:hypothetical protein
MIMKILLCLVLIAFHFSTKAQFYLIGKEQNMSYVMCNSTFLADEVHIFGINEYSTRNSINYKRRVYLCFGEQE